MRFAEIIKNQYFILPDFKTSDTTAAEKLGFIKVIEQPTF